MSHSVIYTQLQLANQAVAAANAKLEKVNRQLESVCTAIANLAIASKNNGSTNAKSGIASEIITEGAQLSSAGGIALSGFDESITQEVKLDSLKEKVERAIVDLSKYTPGALSSSTKKNTYAVEAIASLNALVLLDSEDESRRGELINKLTSMLEDAQLDAKYFQLLSKQLIAEFLDRVRQYSPSDENDPVFRYIALSRRLNLKTQHLTRDELSRRVDEMAATLYQSVCDELFYENLNEVMEEVGLRMDGEYSLDGYSGSLFFSPDDELCEVFYSRDSDGVIFQTLSNFDDSEKEADVYNSMNTVCDKYKMIRELMQKRGFFMECAFEEPVTETHASVASTDNIRRYTRRRTPTARHIGE